jgi:hypothetical protein
VEQFGKLALSFPFVTFNSNPLLLAPAGRLIQA